MCKPLSKEPYCVGINIIVRVRIMFEPASCEVGRW